MSNLVQTKEDLKAHIPMNESFSFSFIKPSVKRAARKHLIPFMGKSFYESLKNNTLSSGSGSSSSVISEAFLLAQEAEANLAWSLYIPQGATQRTDQGFYKLSGSEKRALNHYEQQEMQQEFLEAGLDILDELYTHVVENNMQGFEHPDVSWLIPRASEFNKHYGINNSGRTYMQLNSIIKKEHRMRISPLLPGTLEADLKAYVQNNGSGSGGASEKLDKVLELIRPALCHLAIAKASKQLTCKYDGEAFVVTEYAGPHMKLKSEASLSMIYEKGDAAMKDASDYLNSLTALLKEDTYASYLPEESTEPIESNVIDAGGIVRV